MMSNEWAPFNFANTNISSLLVFRFEVAVVGAIPAGFPSPSLPHPKLFVDMIPDCIVLALVGFAISISLAKIVAKRSLSIFLFVY